MQVSKQLRRGQGEERCEDNLGVAGKMARGEGELTV